MFRCACCMLVKTPPLKIPEELTSATIVFIPEVLSSEWFWLISLTAMNTKVAQVAVAKAFQIIDTEATRFIVFVTTAHFHHSLDSWRLPPLSPGQLEMYQRLWFILVAFHNLFWCEKNLILSWPNNNSSRCAYRQNTRLKPVAFFFPDCKGWVGRVLLKYTRAQEYF